MTDKQKYWLTTPDGAFACVEGKAERDRLVPLGWVDADEPTEPHAFLWMSHDGIEQPAKFPVGSRANWEGMGWTPSGPNPPADPTRDPVPAEASAAPEKTKPAAGADKTSKE